MFLRNPHFCLLNQFFFNQCCAPFMVQYRKHHRFFFFLNILTYRCLFQAIFNHQKYTWLNIQSASSYFHQKGIKKPKMLKKILKVALHLIHSLFFPKKIFCTFANWTIDDTQHYFNKNWLDRQKCGFLRNT